MYIVNFGCVLVFMTGILKNLIFDFLIFETFLKIFIFDFLMKLF